MKKAKLRTNNSLANLPALRAGFLLFIILAFAFDVLATDKVDVNTASLSQLDEITGIGPALAQRIIDARPFSSVDDLLRVRGIGEKTLQKIKDQGLAYVEGQTQQPVQEPGPAATPATAPEPAPSPEITYQNGIFINEILPSPEGPDEQNEWIELYNANGFEVGLAGWKIEDAQGAKTSYRFPEGAKIQAKGYIVLKRPDTKITLNNSEDGLYLFWPDGKTADSMAFSAAPNGKSYNKTDSGWVWSITLTPGAGNKILANALKTSKNSLPKAEKSDNNEINGALAAVSQTVNQEELKTPNPWFLFFTALAATIISAAVVLFIKLKLNNNVRTQPFQDN